MTKGKAEGVQFAVEELIRRQDVLQAQQKELATHLEELHQMISMMVVTERRIIQVQMTLAEKVFGVPFEQFLEEQGFDKRE